VAVEFVSAGRRNAQRDYVDKRKEYQEARIREYWVIDRFRRTLTVFRKGRKPLVVAETETYRTALLPGFELPLGQLLMAADQRARREKK
jgi:Uma2 family endonuclease